jgi:hypothetical protein
MANGPRSGIEPWIVRALHLACMDSFAPQPTHEHRTFLSAMQVDFRIPDGNIMDVPGMRP